MQLQNFSPEPKRDAMLERIEARAATPRETARDMMREGDRLVTDAKSGIEGIRMELKGSGDAAVEEQLKALESDLDAAWDDLATDIKEATRPVPPESGVFARPGAPTEEELDWEIPETEPGKENFDAMNEDQIIDAVNESIAGAFSGDAASKARLMKLLEHPKSGEFAERFLRDDIESKLGDAMDAPSFDARAFATVLELSAAKPDILDAVKGSIAERVGPAIAEKIMKDPAYAERLAELNDALSKELVPGGPILMKERTLKNLAAVHETVGGQAVAFANAIDLKSLSAQLEYAKTESIIEIDKADVDEETGELLTKVSFSMNFEDMSQPADERGRRDMANIIRNFYRETRKTETGEVVPRTYAEHTVFRLPESVKDNGMAAEVTRRSLELYGKDGMNLEEIKLHANIDAGGYVWASYGYGWDREKMAKIRLEKARHKGETVEAGGREIVEDTELTEADERELMRQEITGIINGCINTLDSIQRDIALRGGSYPEAAAAAVRKDLEAALENPDVTPQHLALIGDKAPKLHKGEDGNYYLEDEWPAAQAKGVNAAPGYKKAAHIGKIALLGAEWYGTIELKPDGAQGGANLELLKKTIDRRPKPKQAA